MYDNYNIVIISINTNRSWEVPVKSAKRKINDEIQDTDCKIS